VYEAEQISLGRRVALKVLPFAAALDPRHLRRFHQEAQAAGHLHHTNIVPVFGVGCERGIHYYAMQFIEGQSLAAVIQDLRYLARRPAEKVPDLQADPNATVPPKRIPPAPWVAASTPHPGAGPETLCSSRDASFFQTVASLGVQAAEALEYAHQQGVIHRDIKPANLLLDTEGRLWVTDFGLARMKGDAALTVTGDLIGTLRYMSPEQALANRVGI